MEVSFASALSIVTQEGTNANEEQRTALLQSQLMEYSDVGQAFMYNHSTVTSTDSCESLGRDLAAVTLLVLSRWIRFFIL